MYLVQVQREETRVGFWPRSSEAVKDVADVATLDEQIQPVRHVSDKMRVDLPYGST